MDFDGDGVLDLVSGSYDPGELSLFRGKGRGAFAAREVIKDKSGKPILKVPDQKNRVESFGSWMTLVDWEDDGDLDILVGTFDGMIFMRRNEGTRSSPSYATGNEWVKVGAKALRTPGGEHANPVIADWDGDGHWDIVTGAADGGVYWYRNIGERGRPTFEPPVALVAKHEGTGYSELAADGEPKPGIRSQIAVTDYDGDGKLDILLGDFCTYLHVRKDLTPEQKRAFAGIREKENKATKFLHDSMEELRAKFKEEMKGAPQSDWNTPENSAKFRKMHKAMQDAPEYQKNMAEAERMDKESLEYIDRSIVGKRLGYEPAIAHAYVWLFRRK